jgi:multiple sugar transport system permease protein
MTAVTAPAAGTGRGTVERARRRRTGRVLAYVLLVVVAVLWLFPTFWAVLASFRDYHTGAWTTQNYQNAWTQGDMARHFLNSVYITVPAVLLTLFLSSMAAFVIARFSWRFNLIMLGLFTAANLLPQQSLLIPLFRISTRISVPFWLSDSGKLYDSFWMLILVNTAFQTGFCTFVLSNYIKTLPKELYEAAMVDGASIWRQYWKLTLPLCRPPMAALATLEVTWIYNEFFWATVLMRTGDKFPITSALNNLKGEFFTDNNLLSAGSVLVALPVIIIFFALQRHFVSGLTLGANKG